MLFKQWCLAIPTLFSYIIAQETPSDLCEALGGESDGFLITPNCTDPDYSSPKIGKSTIEQTPIPHYRVSGYFDNTTVQFNFYFPLKDAFNKSSVPKRFFQFAYPTQDHFASDQAIGFGIDSGAYVVQVTGEQGYRAEAAAAKFSRVVAAEYYGTGNNSNAYPFGYIYGGSGGSLHVVGAMENTIGIWDGGIPMVQAIPVSVGSTQSLRAMVGLVLQNKSQEIEQTLRPGGARNPYAVLNEVQQDILREAVLLGLPVDSLEDFDYAANRLMLAQLKEAFEGVDPTYGVEFWTKDGYLGGEESALGDLFRSAVVEFNATVMSVERDDEGVPTAVSLGGVPDTKAFDLDWDSMGYEFALATTVDGEPIGTLLGRFNSSTGLANFSVVEAQGNNASLYTFIQPNVTISISNKNWIAFHAWYRYQVPDPSDDRGYIGFNHLRNNNGSSIYPQRPVLPAPIFAKASAGGSEHSGKINGKMIVIQNLLDFDALPWWAHWYRTQVETSMKNDFEDSYRLWYNSHAEHAFGKPHNEGMSVEYTGLYEHALRDLSAWVEEGIAPAPTTNYTLADDNEVIIPNDARGRGGIQPTVVLSVSLNNTTGSSVGQEIFFTAMAQAPPGTGKIVSFEWDFLGTGNFIKSDVAIPKESARVQASFQYETFGDYFAVVRVTSQREGNAESPYARAMNLGRVRVRI